MRVFFIRCKFACVPTVCIYVIYLSFESFRVLCKFFAHGACLKGEHCEFSHDWKAPPNNVGDTTSSMLDISPIYGY